MIQSNNWKKKSLTFTTHAHRAHVYISRPDKTFINKLKQKILIVPYFRIICFLNNVLSTERKRHNVATPNTNTHTHSHSMAQVLISLRHLRSLVRNVCWPDNIDLIYLRLDEKKKNDERQQKHSVLLYDSKCFQGLTWF